MRISESALVMLSHVTITAFFAITLLGFWGLPLDFAVEAEYISSLLAASAIIFGFWAILLQREPRKELEKRNARGRPLVELFLLSVLLLVSSVVAIYFAALNKIPSYWALWFCLFSFLENALNIVTVLYVERSK